MRGLWALIGACVMMGCASAPASTTTTTTSTVGSETPADPPAPSPQPGSPECEGCTYSSSPGYPDASGRGGIAEWCLRVGSEGQSEISCPMSCCHS